LIYYKDSDIIAGALSFANFSSGKAASSRYVGTPEISPNVGTGGLTQFDLILFFIGIAGGVIIGCAAGIGIGLIISGISTGEKKAKSKKDMKNIEDYYKRQEQYFPNKEIPRSIKDYYKRRKY